MWLLGVPAFRFGEHFGFSASDPLVPIFTQITRKSELL